MSIENKGSMATTVTVSLEPDRSGNYVCSGAADEVDINLAIAEVDRRGGGTVQLLGGTYVLAATISFARTVSDVTLRGVGAGTVLTGAIGVSYITVGDNTANPHNSRVHFENFRIDGTSQTSGHGIYFNGGAVAANRIYYSSVKNCHIESTYDDGVRCRYFMYGEIADNWFYDCNRNGSATGEGALHFRDHSYSNLIEGNEFTTNNWRGISVFNNAFRNEIVGNILLDGVTGAGIYSEENEQQIIGNYIYNYYDPQIWTWGTNNIQIIGNHCVASQVSSGIQVGPNCDRILISGNYCTLNDDWGIELRDSDNCTIENNTCHSNSQNGAGGAYDEISITIIDGTSDDNIVQGNLCRAGPEANKSAYGIDIENSDCNRNIVIDNSLYDDGFVTAAFRDIGTNTKLDSEAFQFIKELNGTYETTSPTGILIDAATETGILQGHIPKVVQQVVRLRIFAVATDTPIGAGGQMHLEITFNAGSPNAAYNTAGTSWNIVNFDGEEADYVANDVVTWVIEDGDVSNELLALVAGDKFEFFVIYETGADPDGATSAAFGSMEIEYV